MAITRKITKTVAKNYLLGFHCAGGRISEVNNDIPIRYNTTEAASNNPEYDGTASTESYASESGAPNTIGTNYTIPAVIISPNEQEAKKDDTTVDKKTGRIISANVSYTIEDNGIGEAACALALRIINYSGDTAATRHDQYSQNGRVRMQWPAPVNFEYFDYPNFKFGFDCSSFVSFIYRIIFNGTSLANIYGKYEESTGRWYDTKYTGSLAEHAIDENLIVNINTFEPNTLLAGDIILYYYTDSTKPYKVGHAALYLGKYDYHPITHELSPGFYIIQTNAENFPLHVCKWDDDWSKDFQYSRSAKRPQRNIRMVFRPSIEYFRKIEGLDCYGLSLTDSEITKTSAKIDTTPDSVAQALKVHSTT